MGLVLSDGTTVIPLEVRERLGLEAGSRLEWTLEDGRAIVRPRAASGPIMELAGIFGNPVGRTVTIEEMDEGITRHLKEEDERIRREWREGER